MKEFFDISSDKKVFEILKMTQKIFLSDEIS